MASDRVVGERRKCSAGYGDRRGPLGALALGVGPRRARVGFGQQAQVIASGALEEVGQFDHVLMARRCIAVAACELCDQDRYCRCSVP